MTLPTLISCLAALLLLAVVAIGLVRIVDLLEVIGGRGDSYLAKLRLGLRAIERETAHLPGTAPTINSGLADITGGLTAVDATLGGLHDALKAQEAKS